MKFLSFITLIFLLAGIGGIAVVATIGFSVGKQCSLVTEEYNGICVPSLINHMQDQKNNREGRLKSIWALGQLSAPEAVDPLNKLLNDGFCDDDLSCEYEISKALKWSTTDKNVLSPIWRQLYLK